MKKPFRLLALAVAILLVCLPLTACKDKDSGETDKNESADSGNDFYGYELPEGIDYKGREVRFLTTSVGNGDPTYQINPESNPNYSRETSSATINMMAECTRLVEQKLNVKIEEEMVIDTNRNGGKMFNKIRNGIMTHTVDYLFCMPSLLEAAKLAQGKDLYDMNKIVDLKNPWWCQAFNDALTINGATYMIAGDIGTCSRDSTLYVAFNKKMAESNHITEKYGCKDLYEMVDKKLWTQDVMYEMARSIYQDLNQNNKTDIGDINGIGGNATIVYWMLKAGGERICENDETGYPQLVLKNDRAISLIEQAQDYFQDPRNGFLCADDYFNLSAFPADDYLIPEFKADRCLFFMNALMGIGLLRDMESDFGVLPCPMYDNTQDNYINNVGAWTSDSICIPITTPEDDLTLAKHVIECLGAVSREKLNPVYYEQTLQYQVVRDDDSMRMLDIIFANRTPDMAETFRWGGLWDLVGKMRTAPKGSFVSAYEAVEDQAKNDIAETVESFKEMQENG